MLLNSFGGVSARHGRPGRAGPSWYGLQHDVPAARDAGGLIPLTLAPARRRPSRPEAPQ